MTKEAEVKEQVTRNQAINDFLFFLATEFVEVRVNEEGQERLVASVVVFAFPLVTGPNLV